MTNWNCPCCWQESAWSLPFQNGMCSGQIPEGRICLRRFGTPSAFGAVPSFRTLTIIEGAGTVFHSDIELFDTDIDKEGLSYSDRASHSSIFTSSSSSISAFSLDSA